MNPWIVIPNVATDIRILLKHLHSVFQDKTNLVFGIVYSIFRMISIKDTLLQSSFKSSKIGQDTQTCATESCCKRVTEMCCWVMLQARDWNVLLSPAASTHWNVLPKSAVLAYSSIDEKRAIFMNCPALFLRIIPQITDMSIFL